MITLKKVSYVGRSDLFISNCNFFGYNQTKIAPLSKELFILLKSIDSNKLVEIYSDDADRQWKRIKSSAYDGKGQPVPEYIDLYHGRVRDDSKATTTEQRTILQDPLLVVTFQPNPCDKNLDPVLVVEFILDHDQYVGRIGAGKKARNISNLRENVIKKIRLAAGKFNGI